ncbi:hypothetical protein [Qipengyuania sp. DGS5-3]|uniref:hypothetical protein n=1 Tax=Qipengyuania sp. DGS5-3 TaxID=3349632 RepID=UPI0036D2D101
MSMQFANLAKSVAEDGHVSAEEILSLRRLGWGDGIMTREEAEAIFTINNQIKDPSDDWVDFFVEAIREFVLNGTEPKYMCDAKEAAWLIAQLDADGKLESMAELEALVRIIERAENVDDSLKVYTLKQIEHAVLNGKGPTRGNGTLESCHITTTECSILRRVVFAAGGEGPAAVSRYEAEMLFRIKDATLKASNALEWPKLFVDGVANYLRGFSAANAQLSHERMKELENFMNDTSGGVGQFFGRMAKSAPAVHNHFGAVFGKKDTNSSFTERAAAGEAVTEAEQNWLGSMVDADGELDALEIQLLERVAEDLS